MPVSLDSQKLVMDRLALLRPNDLVRAGLCQREAEAHLLHEHLQAAVQTFRRVASDERIRRFIETGLTPK
jgi:hypothetical protein